MVGRDAERLSLWSRILARSDRRRCAPVVAGQIDRGIGVAGGHDAVSGDAREVVSGDGGVCLSAGVGRAIDRELTGKDDVKDRVGRAGFEDQTSVE